MSKQQITKCDICAETLPDYRGANVTVTELFVSGDKRRVFPTTTTKHLDLCEVCYGPIAKALTKLGAGEYSNGM